MSLEVAGLLLDLAGIDGSAVGDRLGQAVETIDALAPDDRAAVAMARLIAGPHLDGVSAARAQDLVEALASDLGVQVTVGMGPRLAEDLDAELDGLIADLERRLSHLPAPDRSDLRRSIAEHTKLRRSKVGDIPVQLLAAFARKVEQLEDQLVPTPGPSATGVTSPAPSGASTEASRTEGDPSVDVGPGDHPDEGAEPTEDGAGPDENSPEAA